MVATPRTQLTESQPHPHTPLPCPHLGRDEFSAVKSGWVSRLQFLKRSHDVHPPSSLRRKALHPSTSSVCRHHHRKSIPKKPTFSLVIHTYAHAHSLTLLKYTFEAATNPFTTFILFHSAGGGNGWSYLNFLSRLTPRLMRHLPCRR